MINFAYFFNAFKVLFFLLFFSLILIGCNKTGEGEGEEKLKWFNTQSEAIHQGLKEELITERDIIDKLQSNGEIFVVYKKGEVVGLSNIAEEKGKYTWYRSNPYTAVKDMNGKISFITETLSHKKYYFYIGKVKERETTIETNKGDVNPIVNKNAKLYYFISPK